MKKYCGIIRGTSMRANLMEMLKSFSVYAEEVDKKEEPKEDPKPTINYEDLIAKARKEEKDKQYSTIEKLKTQVNTFTEQHNNDLLKIADLEKQVTEAKKSASGDESEELKSLRKTLETITGERDTLNSKVKEYEAKPPVKREDIEAEVRAELEKEYEVKTYKLTKMTEHKDDILVPELVIGTTKEEIDASIEAAINRSKEIRKSLGIGEEKPRTPKTPSNPSVSRIQDSELSLDKLATMDVASEEYAKLRKQLGLK